MQNDQAPRYVQSVLGRFADVRPTRNGWDARCPCPDHNSSSDHPGDQHASLAIALGDDGRVLLRCRVGCRSDAVLEAAGLEWQDLFVPVGDSREAPACSLPSRPTQPAMDGNLMHRAYELLLGHLDLSGEHAADLHRRGLSDDEISRRQYRTLRNVTRGRAAKAVHESLGAEVLAVPGFTQGDYGITLAGTATGLVIPVRNRAGNIEAIKIRRSSEPKYVYLADPACGASCGSPVHVPVGTPCPAETVRVTEGELKADVCAARDSTPTIGIPGVTQWRSAMPVLRDLGARTAVISFDSPDIHQKLPVFEQADVFRRALIALGFAVEVEVWQ